jgi:hypothetical protein
MAEVILFAFAAWGVWKAVSAGFDRAKGARRAHVQQRVSDARAKAAPRQLGKGRERLIAGLHSPGWWAGEVAKGFPVTRTGLHAGWLAHKTAADQMRHRREEARTTGLETRRSLGEHKQRQAQILREISDQLPPDAKGRRAVREAAGEVIDSPPPGSPRRRQPAADPQPVQAPPQPQAPAMVPSQPPATDPQPATPAAPPDFPADTRPAPGGTMPTGTVRTAEETYDQTMTAFGKEISETEQELARLKARRLIDRVENLASLGVDSDSLGHLMSAQDAARAQVKAAEQYLESLITGRDRLKHNHGNLNEAHQSSPVEAADKEFYRG